MIIPILIIVLLFFNIMISFSKSFENTKKLVSYNLEILWRNRLSILLLVVLYALFWQVGQGQDILVNANTDYLRVLQLFLFLTIFSILNWYLPRIVYEQNVNAFSKRDKTKSFSFIFHYNEDNDTLSAIKKPIEKRTSRVIGTSGIFIMGGAFLNIWISKITDNSFLERYGAAIYLMLTIGIAIWISNTPRLLTFTNFPKSNLKKLKQLRKFSLVLIVTSMSIILGLGIYNHIYGGTVQDMWLLTLSLTIYGYLFLFFVIIRRKIFFKSLLGLDSDYAKLDCFYDYMPNECANLNNIPDTFLGKISYFFRETIYNDWIKGFIKSVTTLNGLKRWWSNWRSNEEGVVIYNVIITICWSIVILFLFFNIVAPTSVSRYPTAVILMSLSFYYIIFMLLDFYSKVRKAPFLLLGIVVLMLFNIATNTHHNINTIDNEGYSQLDKRQEFGTFFNNWIEERDTIIRDWKANNGKYPIFIVLGEGGGSRGGFWSSYVMSDLHESTQGHTDKSFTNHCLAMTGASGGQVGLTMFNTFLEDDLKDRKHNKKFKKQIKSIFQGDFISTSILLIFGRDLWKSFSLTYWIKRPDRASYLENEWTKEINEHAKINTFNTPFLSQWYDSSMNIKGTMAYHMPLLFLNSVSVETGGYGVISPVKFDFSENIKPVLEIVKKSSNNVDKTLSRSASALLGARFPYIMPAGKLANGEHFVDAGYYDNLGGQTAIEIYQKCYNLIEQDSLLKDKLELHFIVLRNDKHEATKLPKDNRSEVTIPINTLLNGRNAHTDYVYHRLQTISNNNLISFDIQHPKDTIIPVSRYMSEVAIDAMIESYKKDKINKNAKSRVLELLGLETTKPKE